MICIARSSTFRAVTKSAFRKWASASTYRIRPSRGDMSGAIAAAALLNAHLEDVETDLLIRELDGADDRRRGLLSRLLLDHASEAGDQRLTEELMSRDDHRRATALRACAMPPELDVPSRRAHLGAALYRAVVGSLRSGDGQERRQARLTAGRWLGAGFSLVGTDRATARTLLQDIAAASDDYAQLGPSLEAVLRAQALPRALAAAQQHAISALSTSLTPLERSGPE